MPPTVQDLMTATVVSLVPYAIEERKPGLIPGSFQIPAAKDGEPQFLYVKESKFDVYAGDNRSIRVSVQPYEVARSIVDDHIDGSLLVTKGVAEPALFWVVGEVKNRQHLVTNFREEVHAAAVRQQTWFRVLVEKADDDWQRYRQHKMVSDLHKHAARALKLDREWLLQEEIDRQLSECPACFVKVNPKAAFCFNCKTILNVEAAAKFTQVGQTIAPPTAPPAKA